MSCLLYKQAEPQAQIFLAALYILTTVAVVPPSGKMSLTQESCVVYRLSMQGKLNLRLSYTRDFEEVLRGKILAFTFYLFSLF